MSRSNFLFFHCLSSLSFAPKAKTSDFHFIFLYSLLYFLFNVFIFYNQRRDQISHFPINSLATCHGRKIYCDFIHWRNNAYFHDLFFIVVSSIRSRQGMKKNHPHFTIKFIVMGIHPLLHFIFILVYIRERTDKD